jgi:hypothetical protein
MAQQHTHKSFHRHELLMLSVSCMQADVMLDGLCQSRVGTHILNERRPQRKQHKRIHCVVQTSCLSGCSWHAALSDRALSERVFLACHSRTQARLRFFHSTSNERSCARLSIGVRQFGEIDKDTFLSLCKAAWQETMIIP